jgi:D-alanine-D-alanine ligase
LSSARLRVAVLMGGISPEHPVSLVSGCGILSNLDPSRYEGFPVLISSGNEWMWPSAGADIHPPLQPDQAKSLLNNPPADWHRIQFPGFSAFPQADIFFIGLHGVGGEDGSLQRILEQRKQPFTGSGSVGSALAMDKISSKQLYTQHSIPTAKWVILEPNEYGEAGAAKIEKELGLPCVVKHPTGGSSIGVAVVRDGESLRKAVRELGKDAPHLLAEVFVKGREATCGVLEGLAQPLPPTEIRPKQDAFFSYEAKYQPGRTEEITPAEFPAEVIAEIQRLARKSHEALQLSVYSRTDFIWSPSVGSGTDGLFALETNNLPGFTPMSILPQQAAKAGINYSDLLTRIIEESLKH